LALEEKTSSRSSRSSSSKSSNSRSSSSSSSSKSSSSSSASVEPQQSAFQAGRRFRRRRGGRRKYRGRRRKKTTTQYFRAKLCYAISLATQSTASSCTGRFMYAIPIDNCTVNYWQQTGLDATPPTTTAVTNAPTDMAPFKRLCSMFDWYKVTGVSLDWFPAFDTEAGTDAMPQQVQQRYPIWTSCDQEDPSSLTSATDPDFTWSNKLDDTTATTAPLTGIYERSLAQRQMSRRMSTDSRWTRYFRINNPKGNYMTVATKGGHAGNWIDTEATNQLGTQYGQVFIEQPYINSNAIDAGAVGRLIVTKYLLFKGLGNQTGKPLVAGE